VSVTTFADQDESPVGPCVGKRSNEIQIDPVRDQAEESDHGAPQSLDIFGHFSFKVAGHSKVRNIHTMCHKKRVLVVLAFGFRAMGSMKQSHNRIFSISRRSRLVMAACVRSGET